MASLPKLYEINNKACEVLLYVPDSETTEESIAFTRQEIAPKKKHYEKTGSLNDEELTS